MALSKEEQSVLDGIEKGLREDLDFASDLDPGQVVRRRRRRALAIGVPGLLLLLLGEMLAMSTVVAGVVVSLCGFLVMMLAFALSSGRWNPGWSVFRRRRIR